MIKGLLKHFPDTSVFKYVKGDICKITKVKVLREMFYSIK